MRNLQWWSALPLVLCALGACDGRKPAAPKPPATNAAPPTQPAPVVSQPATTGSPEQTEVALKPDGGTYAVPVLINGVISLDFTIDSGASDVTLPADVARTLIRSGTLTQADLIGAKTFVMANGEEVPSAEFRLHTLQVGNLVLHDVVASVSDADGSLLLGQTFLSRLKNWSFDNSRHSLVLVTNPDSDSTIAPAAKPIPLAAPTPPNEPETAAAPTELEQAASARAASYVAAWSSPDDQTGEAIRPYYAPEVDYFGSNRSVDQIMVEKGAFARRWPSRNYDIRPGSVTVQCPDAHSCSVTGVIDWRAANPQASRYASGASTFTMTLRDGQITGESSSVLSRH